MTAMTPRQFFKVHAGQSWAPHRETRAQGVDRNARRLAAAEARASRDGLSFAWSIDPDIDSSDWSDDPNPWALWDCVARDLNGAVVASLSGIDFGRDGTPWGDPYRRVVEAELAREALP